MKKTSLSDEIGVPREIADAKFCRIPGFKGHKVNLSRRERTKYLALDRDSLEMINRLAWLD